MKQVKERLGLLREKMAEHKIDFYYIPTNDFHGSEYVSAYFKTREFISGFDGSAGSVLVGKEEAGLWTDGRYFLQAGRQLKDTGITLFKSGQEGVPKLKQYVLSQIPQGGTFATDGRMVSEAWAKSMRKLLAKKDAKLLLSLDLVGEIWTDRPPLSFQKAWLLSEEYAGTSRKKRLKRLRKFMEKRGATRLVVTSLDDIAWLLNIRGNDIPCNPVVLSYFVLTQDGGVLFAGDSVFSAEDARALEQDGIRLMPYEAVSAYLRTLEHETVLVDWEAMNASLAEAFPENAVLSKMSCPIVKWKAVKNPVEVQNMKEAHIRDGVAVTRFLYWLKQNVGKLEITELSAAEKLETFRAEQENYLEPSFEPIAGYAAHGAIVHYSATEQSNAALRPESFLLLDTGGQYLEGTTDITRTIFLGKEASEEQKKYYTAVLRANLNLRAAKFIHGCTGVTLDYAARQPLWELSCDYNHGTGHGVGYLLNVHEAPNAFRYHIAKGAGENAVLEEGMITSDEPGIYLEGKYGIRLENLILCVKREKNEFGQFMGFEPLTLVPFDRSVIDKKQMSEREIALLNSYHQTVYESIGPRLPQTEREWLAEECAPL